VVRAIRPAGRIARLTWKQKVKISLRDLAAAARHLYAAPDIASARAMTTYTAFTTLNDKSQADSLGEALDALDPMGVGVFEVEDGSGLYEVAAYFEAPPDGIALDLLAAAYGARPFMISDVPDTDWVAHVKRELHPVEAGRFFVYGSHDGDKVPEGKIALLIEAQMAFGTGHHGTTLGCLRHIDALADDPDFRPRRIADIGCGTAVLAMAAARVWDAEIIASDIDPVAVDVARANLDANGLGDRITTVTAAGFDAPALAGPYDLVLANILMQPLIDLAPMLTESLAPGGRAILSGLLTEQVERVTKVYAGFGLQLTGHERIGDWSALNLLNKRHEQP
jgi:ribosomal protein L11 methyltransferase